VLVGTEAGSDIDFQVSPAEIQDALTEDMTMLCSLTSNKTSNKTSNSVHHVTSITIYRNEEVVATVTTFTSPQVETAADLINVKVTGNVTGNDTVKGHLKLTWSFPTSAQSGHYECSIAGLTAQGHRAPLVTKQLKVKTASVSVDDLVSELRDLKQVVYQQRNVTYMQQQLIDTDKKMIESLQKQAESDKKMIDSQQSQIQFLTQEVALVEHTESGHVDCGSSGSWTSGKYKASWNSRIYTVSKSVRVNFNTAYSRPPHVQLSIVGIYTGDKAELYGVDVKQVDVSGFTMVCGTHNNGAYRVHDLDVTWTSTADL